MQIKKNNKKLLFLETITNTDETGLFAVICDPCKGNTTAGNDFDWFIRTLMLVTLRRWKTRGTSLQEATGDVALDGVALSRLD